MANKYAVASGDWSATATWSDSDGGAGGATVPADGDAVFISAAVNVKMDVDQSAFTGLLTVTIRGGATPGMLYWSDGDSGYLKIRTGYNLVGTTDTNKGRLLANSNGTWGATGALALANKAVIDLQGTSKIDAQHLDIALYCTQPTNLYVRTYGTKYDFNAATAVDTTNNTIDLGTTPPAADTAVMVIPAAGATLPTPFDANQIYYVRAVSGNTCKLASYSGSDTLIIDITAVGSGTCSLITGHTNTGTKTINILEDLSADAAWVTTAGHNRVALVNILPASCDQQRDTLATIDTSDPYSLTLTTNNIDSAQGPGARIYLSSRNVSIRSSGTSTFQPIVDYANAATASGVFQCEIANVYQPGTQTTLYGYGINYGTGHTISGSIFGCSYGINYGTGHTISGSIFGCSNGINYGTGHTISGSIFGCSYGIFYGTGHTISGSIFGCSNGINSGTGQAISGTVFGCSNGLNYGTGHTISGSIFGCSSGINSVTGHTISGKIGFNSSNESIPNATDFRFGANDTNPFQCVLKNAKIPASPTFVNRNRSGEGSNSMNQGIFSEHHGQVINAQKQYLQMGDIVRTACDGTGDAPSQDPDAGSGYCIEASNIQSNCSTTATLRMIDKQQMWMDAGTYTIAYKVQTTYAGIASGGLILKAEYISDDDPLTLSTEIENETAIAQRSGDTDWSQTIAVTITTAAAGWVRIVLDLAEYESGNEVYVWPVPVIS